MEQRHPGQLPTVWPSVRGSFRDRTLRLPVPASAQTALEIIRFAAANRLCVDLGYHGTYRRIEAYSLRRTSEDDVLLKWPIAYHFRWPGGP